MDAQSNPKKQCRSRLAVFQRVPPKKNNTKKKPFDRAIPSFSDSESDSLMDVKQHSKKRCKGVRLVEEPLKLSCSWTDCPVVLEKYDKFIEHILCHTSIYEEDGKMGKCLSEMSCLWNGCSFTTDVLFLLKQHIVYHGYLLKLQNIGSNVLNRFDLPNCSQTPEKNFPVCANGYVCEWRRCLQIFGNVYEFFEHMKIHVNCFPKYCAKGEIIECEWIGCSYKFPSQYKLVDHLRSHTKERVVACPSCGAMFATKTKFYDHRKRQLPVEEQGYQCSQCSKVFPSERLLKDHIRSHVNHYKCSMCDMTCPKPSTLATHVRYRHFPERPLQCPLCEHRCVSKQALQSHLLTHCSKKLFSCEECDFRCRSLYGLDRHNQKQHGHPWTQTYECHCCKERFSRGNNLTKHLMKQHGFHWPSGHSRFRYKEDTDGIYRLQTVRYESLEVTQEMLTTKVVYSPVDKPMYNLRRCINDSGEIPSFVVVPEEAERENALHPTNKSVLITINDVDEKGNIINSQIIESSEMTILESEELNTMDSSTKEALSTDRVSLSTDRVLRSRKK